MTTPQTEELMQRLEKLERDKRHVLLAAVAAVGLAAVLTLSGQSRPQSSGPPAATIELRRIVFLDEQGKARAELSVEQGPFLVSDWIPRRGSYPSGHQAQRVVPQSFEDAFLFQLANQSPPEVADVYQRVRQRPWPVLVLSDPRGRQRGVVGALTVDETDPHAETWLKYHYTWEP